MPTSPAAKSDSLPCAAVLRHVVDVHCHPTDTPISSDSISTLQITICAMSTRKSDQPLVRRLAEACPSVLPCFGQYRHVCQPVPSGPYTAYNFIPLTRLSPLVYPLDSSLTCVLERGSLPTTISDLYKG